MKQDFGLNRHGNPTHLFTLENERFKISVTDYGAALVSWIDKNRNVELVAGFDSIEDYLNHTAHFGAMIGRVANRIKDAKFSLDSKTYYLSANKGKNSLHGGFDGFDKFLFSGREEGNRLIFTGVSADGDEGYPGQLQITIVYELTDNGIHIEADGISDQKTLFGVTNHSYFNLNGDGLIDHHRVMIPADFYAPNDESGTATGELIACENTPFDFRTEKEISQDFDSDDEQIRMTGGYDHHYSIPGEGLRVMAECKANGLKLVTKSNLPGVHFYTGNFLNGDYTGHGNVSYTKHSRVCFEPEFYPNAINLEVHKKPILNAGEHDVQIIEYLLYEEDEQSS